MNYKFKENRIAVTNCDHQWVLEDVAKWNRETKSQLGQQNSDAKKNGYDFYLFSNTKIPNYVKTFCDSRGIKYLETLD